MSDVTPKIEAGTYKSKSCDTQFDQEAGPPRKAVDPSLPDCEVARRKAEREARSKYFMRIIAECDRDPMKEVQHHVDSWTYCVVPPHHVCLGLGDNRTPTARTELNLIDWLRSRGISATVRGPYYKSFVLDVSGNSDMPGIEVYLQWSAEHFVRFDSAADEVRYGAALLAQFGPPEPRMFITRVMVDDFDAPQITTVWTGMLDTLVRDLGSAPAKPRRMTI